MQLAHTFRLFYDDTGVDLHAYISLNMLHRTAWLAGSVSAMERACVFVC